MNFESKRFSSQRCCFIKINRDESRFDRTQEKHLTRIIRASKNKNVAESSRHSVIISWSWRSALRDSIAEVRPLER